MLPDTVHTPAPLPESTENTTGLPELADADRVAEPPTIPGAGAAKEIDWARFWPLTQIVTKIVRRAVIIAAQMAILRNLRARFPSVWACCSAVWACCSACFLFKFQPSCPVTPSPI